MFSIIPANRPCITNFVTISPTQFAFSFPASPHFSHLVVFILPGNALPPNTAAGVHVQLPGSTEFKFFGAIGNEKPSAIFKVNLPGRKHSHGDLDAMADFTTAVSSSSTQPDNGEVNLGISVEPLPNVLAQLATLQSQTQSQPPSSPNAASSSAIVVHRPSPQTKVLAQRIIRDAFNFLASFAGGGGQSGQEVVPLKSFQDWWMKFERRVENDPGFLEREDGV